MSTVRKYVAEVKVISCLKTFKVIAIKICFIFDTWTIIMPYG